MAYGKTITIYLEKGTPDGMVTAALSNWNGVCVKVPRDDVAKTDFEELDAPGVYFLICTDTDDGQDAVYIGEAENLRKRLMQHIQDYKSNKEKYYWQNAIIFTGSELNKTLIRYLEHNLTVKARAAKRYTVLTKNTYADSIIKRHEKAAMAEFMDNIQVLLAALNYRILEPLAVADDSFESDNTSAVVLSLFYGGYSGKGYVTLDGKFVLLAGAEICPTLKRSCPENIRKLRASYADRIVNGVTTEDIIFNGSSGAAAFIGGASLSGPHYWKNAVGKSLKEIREEA